LWQSIAATLSLALHNDAYTHIIMISPITVALILSEWSSVKSTAVSSVKSGLYLLALGTLIVVLNRWLPVRAQDLQLAVNMLALVILWISAFTICFGTSVARSRCFPLCFLFWIVPIPALLLTDIVRWLQHGSAIVTWLLLSVAGVPAARDGVLVTIPGLTIQVAAECSSIRSSLMLLVTTMVVAHLLLKTRWRKILLVLIALPLSVAKNGLRIFTLAMLGTHVDRSFLTGRLHRDGGILFFAIALATLTVFLWLLRRSEATISYAPRLNPANP
jgi:exosortase